MRNRRLFMGSVVLLFLAAFLAAFAVAPMVGRVPVTDTEIVGNNAVNGDASTIALLQAIDPEAAAVAQSQADNGIGKNNFGWNVYEAASKHIAAGNYSNVLDYVYTANGEGDFIRALYQDRFRAAAIITNYVNVINPTDKILADDTWQQPVGQQPNYVADAFGKDHDYWTASVDKFVKVLHDNATADIVELDDYTSSMYMYHNGRGNLIPDIVVRNSNNAGGHALVFDFGKAGILKFRLECGYQPLELDYWTPPELPPEDDDTPDVPDVPLTPKDPDAGPQAKFPDNSDFGGGQNHDNDKTVTEEPESPENYTPPTPPSSDDDGNGDKKTTEDKDLSDRHNGGGTETVDGEEYEVIVGEEDKSIDDAQAEHDSSTVEEPVKGDDNSGSLDAPE